jgi:hypothetical protein
MNKSTSHSYGRPARGPPRRSALGGAGRGRRRPAASPGRRRRCAPAARGAGRDGQAAEPAVSGHARACPGCAPKFPRLPESVKVRRRTPGQAGAKNQTRNRASQRCAALASTCRSPTLTLNRIFLRFLMPSYNECCRQKYEGRIAVQVDMRGGVTGFLLA